MHLFMSILWPVLGEEGTAMGMASVLPSRKLQTFPLPLERRCEDDASTMLAGPQQVSPWFYGGRGGGVG